MAHPSPTIRNAFDLIQRALEREHHVPVAPFATPDELLAQLDLGLGAEGAEESVVSGLLDGIAAATPRTSSPRFLNQLFGGRDDIATAAELLSVVLNSSMYTFKASGPHGVIERELTVYMAKKMGFDNGEGVFAAGGSMSNFAAIIMARNQSAADFKDDGHTGARLTLYTSDLSHYSINKGAALAGIGRNNVRRIPTDRRGRMIPEALEKTIQRDIKNGATPFMVNATAGTTVLGAFDPIREIAAIARRFDLWLHMDGALGGAVILSEEHRHLLDGSELADSITWDAHKMMTVPLVCSVVLTREKGKLAEHFNEDAGYLFQADSDDVNFGAKSLQCGRRNDALKLWALWKKHGDIGLGKRIDHLFELAAYTADAVRDDSEMTLSKEPESINVCFEFDGAPSPELCETLRRRNRLVVGYGEVDERDVIRMPFVNPNLTFDDIDVALEEIRQTGRSLSKESPSYVKADSADS